MLNLRRVKYLKLMVLSALVDLNSCAQSSDDSKYPKQVGDIYFDAKMDDPNFKICTPNRVSQYFNFGKSLQYRGEKVKIIQGFSELFNAKGNKKDSGFVTIRFIVNCEGKTGWFRVQGMGIDYKEKKFSADLVNNLLAATRKLDGWIIGGDSTNKIDYYQYLTFKIERGNLVEIMP
jgi:hypothetical protein